MGQHGKQRVRIRENKVSDALWLDRLGQWGPYAKAARFASQEAAIAFADRKGVKTFGLFPYNAVFRRP